MANKFIALPAFTSADSADGDTVVGLDLSAKREVSWTLVELAKAVSSRLVNAISTGTLAVSGATTLSSTLAAGATTITGTTAITGLLDVTNDKLRLRTAKTPATAAAAGNAGDICWDSGFLYVCVSSGEWKRVAIATW
jgi:hypothetical protein